MNFLKAKLFIFIRIYLKEKSINLIKLWNFLNPSPIHNMRVPGMIVKTDGRVNVPTEEQATLEIRAS